MHSLHLTAQRGEKHPTLPRTYLLNKKDGKMVKSGMAKMVGPEVAED